VVGVFAMFHLGYGSGLLHGAVRVVRDSLRRTGAYRHPQTGSTGE
jgi:hypothetical protein